MPSSSRSVVATSRQAPGATFTNGNFGAGSAARMASPCRPLSLSMICSGVIGSLHEDLGPLAHARPVEDPLLLHLLLDAEEGLEQRLGPRRAAWQVDVDRDDAVHALEDVV